MNISLTPELEKLVQNKVKTGSYLSASEVVREALRLLQERDSIHELRVAELRKQIKRGVDEIERGEGIAVRLDELPEYKSKLRERALKQLKANRARKR